MTPPSAGIGANIKGQHDGIPAIDRWDIPDDRIYAVDLNSFCQITEAAVEEGCPLKPTVDIEEIDAAGTDAILGGWEPEENEAAESERRQRVLTSAKIDIRRPYRLRILEADAARSMKIPGSYLS